MATKPLDEQARERVIEAWMLRIVRDGGIARFDNLHIDQIDEGWEPREMWVQGGMEAFRLALMVRDRHKFRFIVGLGFSLESGATSTDFDFQTGEELISRVDWSAPSLYLFEREKNQASRLPWCES